MADIFDIFKRLEQNKTAPSTTPITHLLVGLGNPGKQYALTRHNAGWLFMDVACEKYSCPTDRSKFNALVGETTITGTSTFTFTFDEARAVKSIMVYNSRLENRIFREIAQIKLTCLENGKTRAIGTSNFYDDRFYDLAHSCNIKPAINQLETNIFSQQTAMRALMKETETQVMAWGPMAQGKNNFFNHEVLSAIGEKYGKNASQVGLRFLTQQGIPVIVVRYSEDDTLNVQIHECPPFLVPWRTSGRLPARRRR